MKKNQVMICDNTIYTYGSSLPKHIGQFDPKAHVLRTVASTTIWHGDYHEVNVPKSVRDCDDLLAVEPHLPGSFSVTSILHSVGNKIRIENTRYNPVSLRKHEHFCQVRPVYVPSTEPEPGTSHNGTKNTSRTHVKPSIPYSSQVTIDPDAILTRKTVQAMKYSLARNDTVFSPISRGYNGQAGPFQARVNIGPVMPPQRKGRLHQYSSGQRSYFKPSSTNLNLWAYSRSLKILESQSST